MQTVDSILGPNEKGGALSPKRRVETRSLRCSGSTYVRSLGDYCQAYPSWQNSMLQCVDVQHPGSTYGDCCATWFRQLPSKLTTEPAE